MNKVKNILMSLIGLSFIFPKEAWLSAQTDQNEPLSWGEEQTIPVRFSKGDLIKSLQQLKRHPEKIHFVSAECYMMAMLPPEVDYQCDLCGKHTIYKRDSDSGQLVDSVAAIRRSLAQMPYEIVLDTAGLCPVCGRGKDNTLVIHMNCFDCGKEFTWQVRTWEDIQMLRWLYLKHPVTTIDSRDLGLGDQNAALARGAEYIRNHVFCPDCRKKIHIE